MLQIKNLFVKYHSAKSPSIQDISFDLEKGDQIAMLGCSGCGKSTTLNVIAGLLTSKNAEIKGEINWNNEKYILGLTSVGKLLQKEKKPVIRMVFQESMLLPWRTVEKNIALGLEIEKLEKKLINDKVKKMLKMVGLEEFANHYPYELSVGMAQRANFARALVCEPDLLLLDEPFSALDSKTKKTIQSEFIRIIKEKGISSIFVTHSMEEAVSMANKIIILSGKPASVLSIISNGVGNIPDANEIKNLDFYNE